MPVTKCDAWFPDDPPPGVEWHCTCNLKYLHDGDHECGCGMKWKNVDWRLMNSLLVIAGETDTGASE